MPYEAEISRLNPGVFLFLIDQSGSMDDPFGGAAGKKKSEGLADAVNRLLQNLIIKCTKSDGVRDYFEVGVIAYGPGGTAKSAFIGALEGEFLVPISKIADNPARIEERERTTEDGAGGLIKHPVKFPVWFDPVAENGTPMCYALEIAYQVLSSWTKTHVSSFPPVVINITDGEATDGNPLEPARALQNLATNDGQLLLFNCHISSTQAPSILFPSTQEELPRDEFASLLFAMSSILPPKMREAAVAEGFQLGPQPRGFAFNADLVDLIRFLDIGTRPKGELR